MSFFRNTQFQSVTCSCSECSLYVDVDIEADADGMFPQAGDHFCARCEEHCCNSSRDFCGVNGCVECGKARGTTNDVHGNLVCKDCAVTLVSEGHMSVLKLAKAGIQSVMVGV